MRYVRASRLARTAAVIGLLAIVVGPGVASAFPLWGDTSVGVTQFHQTIVYQGDDPSVSYERPRDTVQVIDRSFWSIPWNSTEVYTYVSPLARNVTVDNVEAVSHQGSTIFVPGDFSAAANPEDPPATGWMEGAEYGGYYYWRFPEQADRDLSNTLVFETAADFEDADPDLTDLEDWNVTDGALRLASNVSSASHVSKRYTGGVAIVSINATVTAEHGENMTFHVSGDNGTSWSLLEPGTPLDMTGKGYEFRWMVTMEQNASANETPELEAIAFDVRFTPATTDIWIEAIYTLDIVGGRLDFDLTFPFDVASSSFIFVGHVDPDMGLEMEGANINQTTSTPYPGKVTYTHMGGDRDIVLTVRLTDQRDDDGGTTSSWLYVGILILVIMLVAGIAMVLRSDRSREPEEEGPPADEDADAEDGPGDPTLLEGRKAEILEEIKELDGDHEIGLIDDREHEARRRALKSEAVEVMKRLDEGR